jgi:L-threonylcarbamoyladenylate synthase
VFVAETLGPSLGEQIEKGVTILRRGGIVVYPTDTLYGMGVDAFCEEALECVFAAKGRPLGMPLPLLLGSISELQLVTDKITPTLEALAERFWPGPLTLVLAAGKSVPSLVTARGWTVAIRIPNHPVALELVRRFGGPITGTSANRSGSANPSNIDVARREIGPYVDLVIDGGPIPKGQASTILDISGPVPRILREGLISEADIQRACPNLSNVPPLGLTNQE